MTYCDLEWISDITYEQIHDQIMSEGANAAAVARPMDTQEHLAVFGRIDLETDEVTLDAFYRLAVGWDGLGRVPGE